jgi:amidase
MNTGAGKKLSARLNELTAAEIARLVSVGEVTCEAVVRACLERIAQREPEVGAWHYLNPERVIAKARDIDKGSRRGPLIGVPFGIKDIIDSCDMPTEYGSPIYRGHQPKNDATCIALGRKAGALLLGKTVTTEFANQYPGKTRNPFDPTRTPGGSSSGSAAAVGDCMVPFGNRHPDDRLHNSSRFFLRYIRLSSHLRRLALHRREGGGRFARYFRLIARSVEDISLYRDVLLGIEPQLLPAAPSRSDRRLLPDSSMAGYRAEIRKSCSKTRHRRCAMPARSSRKLRCRRNSSA